MKALSIMVKAYNRATGSSEYPLYELIDILGYEDEDEVFEFCSRVGLRFDRESLYIRLNKEQFREPEGPAEQNRAFNLVLSKRLSAKQSVGECVAGGQWPEQTYEGHKPHSSFDAQGRLLRSSLNAQDQNIAGADPYEFMEEDEDAGVVVSSEVKAGQVGEKVFNNVEGREKIVPVVR